MGAGEDDFGGRERKAAAVAYHSIKLKIFTGTHTHPFMPFLLCSSMKKINQCNVSILQSNAGIN